MCHETVHIFGKENIKDEWIFGKSILEVGSNQQAGSIKYIIMEKKPSEYIGVDIIGNEEQGVDIICDAKNLVEKFGKERFDFVMSTEMLEHIDDWRSVASNIKRVVRKDGRIFISARSKGFPYHGYPSDFWRFELDDFRYIWGDFIIEKLEKDWAPNGPGVFLVARKPLEFTEKDEKDLLNYNVYSMTEMIR